MAIHRSRATSLECGCILPGSPCERLEELAEKKDTAYGHYMAAQEEYDRARSTYQKEQARAELQEARERYEELTRAYREHRVGPTKNAAQPEPESD